MPSSSSVDLHYKLEGLEDAPVLVMSNSLGTTLQMWNDQALTLSKRFRLLRYDHRGHGASPVLLGPYTVDDLGRDAPRTPGPAGDRELLFLWPFSRGDGWYVAGERGPRTHRTARAVLYVSQARTTRELDIAGGDSP